MVLVQQNTVIAEIPYLVLGGGIVGSAIAYGIAHLGQPVIMLDGGDGDMRASRGNFGLVWVEGKGWNIPAYARLAQKTAIQWDKLAIQLQQETGLDMGHVHTGGFNFILEDSIRQQHEQKLKNIQNNVPSFQYEFLPYDQLVKTYPHLGKDVIGAFYCQQNGIVNPLNALYAFWQGIVAKGGTIETRIHVNAITPPSTQDGLYHVNTNKGIYRAEKIILSMGLHNQAFGIQVGLHLPVRKQRGQIIATEKVRPILDIPSLQIRQTVEGSLMIGETHENDVDTTDTTITGMQFMAERALRIFPLLKHVNSVRCWGAMRILTPDGGPIYEQNQRAYGVALHSGVTMAAYHAYDYAHSVVYGQTSADVRALSGKRFHV